ncbi:DnaJ domain containing protein [Trichuris trichiura]|uniref:DnaJ domain containing protein n=1 Tax=Trichuris trichiura TaxID=36087 RepID=A0A077ZN98_TRITR|nr:DnaJ domain containing protein [Trichuris trichiura]
MAYGRKCNFLCFCFNRYLLNQRLYVRNSHSTATQHTANLYDVLKVPVDASAQEIKDSYYTLSRQYHPDLNSDKDCIELTQKFQELNNAYQILGNEIKRIEYDRTLRGDFSECQNGQPFGTSKYEMDSEQMRDYMEFRRRFGSRRPMANSGFDAPNSYGYDSRNGPESQFHWNMRGYPAYGNSWAENSSNYGRPRNNDFHNYVRLKKRQAEQDMNVGFLTIYILVLTMIIIASSVPQHTGPPPW